jgi:hypothetical protein
MVALLGVDGALALHASLRGVISSSLPLLLPSAAVAGWRQLRLAMPAGSVAAAVAAGTAAAAFSVGVLLLLLLLVVAFGLTPFLLVLLAGGLPQLSLLVLL